MRWALAGLAALAVAAPGCLNDFDAPGLNDLRIARVDVAAPVVRSGNLELAIHATLDNGGATSGPIRLVVSAYDTGSQLLAARQEAPGLPLAKDTTRTVEVRLTVPRAAGYRIEVVVYENDRALRTATVNVANLDGLPPNVHETGLRVAGMDFQVDNVSANRVAIRVSTYLTNEGGNSSPPLRMQLKAREVSTDLLADEAWVDVGAVGAEETRVHNVTLTVPSGYNYAVEATLWDAHFIVERGTGNVQLLPTFTQTPGASLVVASPDIRDFQRGTTTTSPDGLTKKAPSAGPALVLLGVALLVLLIRSPRRT